MDTNETPSSSKGSDPPHPTGHRKGGLPPPFFILGRRHPPRGNLRCSLYVYPSQNYDSLLRPQKPLEGRDKPVSRDNLSLETGLLQRLLTPSPLIQQHLQNLLLQLNLLLLLLGQ